MSDHSASVKSGVTRLVAGASQFLDAAAGRMGVNGTDLRCLLLVAAQPGVSASRLAELTGLTTGAITGVLDRLERAGYARREPDPTDRRRTLVRLVADRRPDLERVVAPIDGAIAEVLTGFSSSEQAAIAGFVLRAGTIYEEAAARLHASTHGGMVGEMFTAPLGDASEGRLVLATGAPRVSVRAAPLGPATDARVVAELARSTVRLVTSRHAGELARATFSGPVPDVRAGRDGSVTVRYRTRLDWRQRHAEVGLSDQVPWSVAISGGLSALSGDLRGLRLRSLDLRGGVDELELDLPEPDGTSRVRIADGPAHVSLLHPRGSALRATVDGGVHELRFGDQRMRDVHGRLRLETPDAASAPDRYEVEIEGGVRALRVMPA